MKKINILVLLFYVSAFLSCKKSGSSTSAIIGAWRLTDISGTYSNNLTSSTGYTTTLSYNTDSSILTETSIVPGIASQNVSVVQLNSEVWSLNSNGTYTIKEIYTVSPGSSNLPDSSDAGGTWEFLSNTQVNNGLLLGGGLPYILSTGNDNIYTIEKLNASTLQLWINSSQYNAGATTSSDITLTFTRM